MAKPLLIGSVFATDSAEQLSWLKLQQAWIKATTPDFEYVAVVTESSGNTEFTDLVKTLDVADPSLIGSEAHLQGLRRLHGYFQERQAEFQNFLFMDGDAFPISKGWMGTLLAKMSPVDRVDESGTILPLPPKGRHYDIAAILRSENLERRLHASVLFVKTTFLKNVGFDCGSHGLDLLCEAEKDIYITTYQEDLRHKALPLIRTNMVNVHPVACGIYFDMFYHHCCGSGRMFSLRSMEYLDRVIQPSRDVSVHTRHLMESPSPFVSRLAGWNPHRYATVSRV